MFLLDSIPSQAFNVTIYDTIVGQTVILKVGEDWFCSFSFFGLIPKSRGQYVWGISGYLKS